MRAERLLRLLLHLQTRGRSTVAQLAAALEVSPRTVQRDLDALSLAGVPVYSIRGRGGGWTVLPDYRSRLTGLTPSEVMSVFVGATAHVLADLGLDASSELAVTKLISSLPDGTRREAEYARQRLLIDHAGWDDRRETPRWLDLCRQAVWEERHLKITYGEPSPPPADTTATGSATAPGDTAAADNGASSDDGTAGVLDAGGRRRGPFVVAPLGLVAKARTWYLVAARTDGRLRTYRLSRLTSAELTDDTFTRPADFDLATYWARAQREFQASRPSYPIVLKVRDHAVRRFRTLQPMHPAENNWWIIHTDLENPHEACAAVLAQAGAAQVVAPSELITMVREAARLVADSH
ncbi:WYL domain-containing protein [Kribbella sp. NPDC003505]|uniref:helix-turn-helix transcriptional regulator n=1 Tax=Kribbella sp. NPDC003505 TaxID=3154448 RepID=UPI0033A68990